MKRNLFLQIFSQAAWGLKKCAISFLLLAFWTTEIHAQELENDPTQGAQPSTPTATQAEKDAQKKADKLPEVTKQIKALAKAPRDAAVADKCLALLKKPSTYEEADQQARELLKLLTPEERYALPEGGIRYGLGRVGLPALQFSDATGGLHKLVKDKVDKATALPAPILLAATWNPRLAYEYAKAVAEEFRTAGFHMILGPGMNVYRVSRCGRNFEYFGEDPYLISRMVESYVKGAQDVGVGVTLKHFAANNNEYRRRGTDVIVDERALREIYLPGFKAGIDAGAWGVMTSYNLVDGEWCGQNKYVITDLLRGALGFRNMTMTDWGSVSNGDAIIASGQDLEMPSGEFLFKVKDRYLGSAAIDEMTVCILRTGIWSGFYELEAADKFRQPEWISKLPDHAKLGRKIAGEGVTLLKNDGLLPLAQPLQGTILVTGNWAKIPQLSGFGTARVDGYNNQSYFDVLTKKFGSDKVAYAEAPTDDQIKQAAVVLVFPGHPQKSEAGKPGVDPFQYEGEGRDPSFVLKQDTMIAHCTELNPHTVVYITTGGGVQMDWADKAAAIFQSYYSGQSGAPVMVDLLTGKLNPSGKLPYTIEKKFEDSPGFGYDKDNPSSKSYTKETAPNDSSRSQLIVAADGTFHPHELIYQEGIFVGYRWYDEKKIQPQFPFGHGLSYTTFAYKNMKVQKDGDHVQVGFDLSNSGKLGGAEVAQVYVHDQATEVAHTAKELKGFKKIFLKPGEVQHVQVTLGPEAFQYWSEKTHQWTLDPGKFDILVGSSSRDIRAQQEIQLP